MDYTCKNCGNVFGDYIKFCPSCGTPVELASQEPEIVEADQTEAAAQPEVQAQPDAQQAYQQQAYQQQAYQQQAYQQQPYQQQPYQQQAYQQPYQQQAYQQQAYQQQAYQQQPYQQQAYQQQPYQQQAYQQQAYQTNGYPNMMTPPKSKMAAGLLGIFLGGFGVHNFYLGFTSKAVIQIVVSLITCGIGSLWGFIEGIMILTGSINTDASGRPLGE